VRGYLELQDRRTIKEELLSSVDLANLTEETLTSLKKVGCISEEEYVRAKQSQEFSESAQQHAESLAAYELGLAAYSEEKYQDADQCSTCPFDHT